MRLAGDPIPVAARPPASAVHVESYERRTILAPTHAQAKSMRRRAPTIPRQTPLLPSVVFPSLYLTPARLGATRARKARPLTRGKPRPEVQNSTNAKGHAKYEACLHGRRPALHRNLRRDSSLQSGGQANLHAARLERAHVHRSGAALLKTPVEPHLASADKSAF